MEINNRDIDKYKMNKENEDLVLSMWDDMEEMNKSEEYIWNIISDTLNIDIDAVRNCVLKNRFEIT